MVRQALTLDGLTVSALIPNLKGAERGVALGVHEARLRALGERGATTKTTSAARPSESIADLKRVIELRNSLETGRRVKVVAGLATCFGCTIEGHGRRGRVFAIAAEVLALERRRTDGRRHRRLRRSGRGPPGLPRVARHGRRRCRSARISTTRAGSVSRMFSPRWRSACAASTPRSRGLGGCPFAPGATGNIVMEDIAFMLETMGLRTGVDLERLIEVRRIVEGFMPGMRCHGDLRQGRHAEKLLCARLTAAA